MTSSFTWTPDHTAVLPADACRRLEARQSFSRIMIGKVRLDDVRLQAFSSLRLRFFQLAASHHHVFRIAHQRLIVTTRIHQYPVFTSIDHTTTTTKPA